MYKYLIALTSDSLGFEKTLAVADSFSSATELQKKFDKLLMSLSRKSEALDSVYIESKIRIFQFPVWTEENGFEDYRMDEDYLAVWIKSFIRMV